MRQLSLAVAAMLLGACAPAPTQLIVVVDTDFDVPGGLDLVEVTVTGPDGARFTESQVMEGSGSLPLTLTVVPESLERLGPLQIEAVGSHDGTDRVTRHARVTLVREQTLMLPMFLFRSCEGVTCGASMTCGADGCGPVEVSLYPWTGTPIRIGDDAGAPFDGGIDVGPTDAGPRDGGGPRDVGPGCSVTGCDDENPCTDDVCEVDGTCEHEPNALSCDDGLFCNGLDTCGGGTCSVHAGDPCIAPTTCDEATSVCTGCADATHCPADTFGAWGACEGFASACATAGTEARTVRTFTCEDGACVPADESESRACSRPTDGMVCGATSCDPFGACEGAGCALTGTQSRTCRDQVCSGGTCAPSPRTETAACSRPTDGTSCGATSCDGWGACGGFADTCTLSGTHSRTCTDPVCSGGACGGAPRSESEACTRPSTDGPSCGATTCGDWGACEFADACTTTGTMRRTCNDPICSGGGCASIPRTETTGCSRGSTDGMTCAATSCTAFGACTGFTATCDEEGTHSRTCTDYVCGGGTCNGSSRGETEACYRDQNGVHCGGSGTTTRCCDTGACICCFC
jgi:hypothetical protein